MNNIIIMVIGQLWYQMIRNHKSNTFLIETSFPKTKCIPIFMNFDQQNDYWKDEPMVVMTTKIEYIIYNDTITTRMEYYKDF